MQEFQGLPLAIAYDHYKAEAAKLRRQAMAEAVDRLVRLFARRRPARASEPTYDILAKPAGGQ